MIKSILSLFFFTISFYPTAVGQDDYQHSLLSEQLHCENDSLTIHIPAGYSSKDTFNYMEGFIQTYEYPDGSSLSVLCGSNASLVLGDDQTKNLHYRISKLRWHEITYQNVTSEMLADFELAFDLMEKE